MKTRVVITGIGVVTPVGIGLEAFWNSLTNGVSGFGPISVFDTAGFSVHQAAEVKDLAAIKLPAKQSTWSESRGTTFALGAAMLALEHAQIKITDENRARVGVAFGTTLAGLNLMSKFDRRSIADGPRDCDPGMFPDTGFSAPACRISVLLGARAFNVTLSNGETSSLDAMQYAASFIRGGRAHTVLVGGVEELCLEAFLGYDCQQLLASSRNDGLETCMPFDRRRHGVVLGEGGTVLVFEEYEHARQRGVPILADYLGYGTAFNPCVGAMKGRVRSVSRAMERALDDAGVQAPEVDLICCNANSSRPADVDEARAISHVFGKSSEVLLTATKSMLGESYSAAGAMQVAAAALSIHSGAIPPTIHCDELDPRCRIGRLVTSPMKSKVGLALINSFGCNGSHASVVLGNSDPGASAAWN